MHQSYNVRFSNILIISEKRTLHERNYWLISLSLVEAPAPLIFACGSCPALFNAFFAGTAFAEGGGAASFSALSDCESAQPAKEPTSNTIQAAEMYFEVFMFDPSVA